MEFENSRLNPLAGAAQSEQLAAYAPNERKEQNVTLEDSNFFRKFSLVKARHPTSSG